MKNSTLQKGSSFLSKKNVLALKVTACISAALLSHGSAFAQNTSYNANTLGTLGVQNCVYGSNNQGFSTATANYNVGVGVYALSSNTTGDENVAVGHSALGLTNGASRNTGAGHGALGAATTGADNAGFGNRALLANTTGNFNTALGSYADVGSGGLSNAAAIGANAKVMNSNHMILGDNSVNVGIGLSGDPSGPQAKLHVVSSYMAIKADGSTLSGFGIEANGWTGVLGKGTFGIDGLGSTVGVRGSCFGSGNVGLRIGTRGAAGFGALNYGGYFQGSGSPSSVTTFGVYAEISQPTLGGVNYGVYSTVAGNNNSGAGPNYAGYFNGDVVTAGGSYYYSDSRLKKNITKIDNSLTLIKKLNPVNYNFDLEANPNMALPSEKQYGFISQEVKELMPELSKTLIHPAKHDDEGKEIAPSREVVGLNYNGFIALLTKGMQEQQATIEQQALINSDLQRQLDEQKELIASLQKGTTGITGLGTVETGFSMSQNEPNPFTHETLVKYTLPQNVQEAAMMVYDLSGKQVASFPITQKGSASLSITSDKLAAGIYIYSIVADGRIMDSKRMVVADK